MLCLEAFSTFYQFKKQKWTLVKIVQIGCWAIEMQIESQRCDIEIRDGSQEFQIRGLGRDTKIRD